MCLIEPFFSTSFYLNNPYKYMGLFGSWWRVLVSEFIELNSSFHSHGIGDRYKLKLLKHKVILPLQKSIPEKYRVIRAKEDRNLD